MLRRVYARLGMHPILPAGLLLTVATETSYGFSVTGIIPGDELDGVTVNLEALP